MEASVLTQPAKLTGIGVRAPFRRLLADERLIALIRAGDQAAFETLVQRYRSRLLSFCRRMLASQEDAEDVLQEVFAAAYRAIAADERTINVRPWLYRIARNMCLKHLGKRRPPADGGIEDLEVAAMGSTDEVVHMRESLRQIVVDVRELPETQRTALLLREIDGLSYGQIALAMDTSVPGVKSLLVRARVSLAEAAEGRLLSCEVVHLELRQAADGLGSVTGAARRHVRQCELCRAYRSEVRAPRRARAAALFVPLAPLALIRGLIGRLGDGAAGTTGAGLAGSGAAGIGAAGASAVSGAGGAVSATLGAVGTKAAVAVATATLVAAGASDLHRGAAPARHEQPAAVRATPAPVQAASAPARSVEQTAPARPRKPAAEPVKPRAPKPTATTKQPVTDQVPSDVTQTTQADPNAPPLTPTPMLGDGKTTSGSGGSGSASGQPSGTNSTPAEQNQGSQPAQSGGTSPGAPPPSQPSPTPVPPAQ